MKSAVTLVKIAVKIGLHRIGENCWLDDCCGHASEDGCHVY